ncbi:MAG: EsaB/YukD family protein [Ktedonobacterales bacterium]
MASLMVTVYGPHGRLDIEIPASAPLHDVIPLLVQVCAPEVSGTQWANAAYFGIGPIGGQPFPPDRTLDACGLMDGAALAFQDMASWRRSSPNASVPLSVSAAPGLPSSPMPPMPPLPAQVDAAGIGIRWNKDALLS